MGALLFNTIRFGGCGSTLLVTAVACSLPEAGELADTGEPAVAGESTEFLTRGMEFCPISPAITCDDISYSIS